MNVAPRAGVVLCAVLFATVAQAAPVRFGVQTPAEDLTYEQMRETWRLIESLGYDSVWLADHLAPVLGDKDRPYHEAWTLLAALAAQTPRIRVGVLVTSNTFRPPALLAKMATTVDHVSGGRLALGIGAGWEEAEHRAFGIAFHTAKERAARLGEALEVITRLWRDDHPTMTGRYYALERAPFAPPPLQRPHPPIVVGGQGPQWIMPLVARWADEWNVPLGITPGAMRERLRGLEAECTRLARSPCVRDVSVFLVLGRITDAPVAETPPAPAAMTPFLEKVIVSLLQGTPEQITAKIRTYVDAGASSVIVVSTDHARLRRFAADVMPAFR
jgi:F420-dependent oxidoreductase-like protein